MSANNSTGADFELAKSHFLNGLDFFNRKLYPEAESSFRASLSIIPNRESVLVNLSATLLKLDKYSDAKNISKQVLELNNLNQEAWLNLGNALLKLQQYEQSITAYDKAISTGSELAEIWYSRGIALQELKQHEQALTSYDKAISIDPESAESWSNRGNILQELKQYEQAINSYDKAISINPGYANARYNRGIAFQELKQYKQAINSYDEAVNIDPKYADAYWNKSLIQLLTGDFQDGWTNYEYRWHRNGADKKRYQEIKELENINEAESSTVLVWWEQGYGDVIQFSRYVPLLAELAAEVVFVVPVALKTLLERSFPTLKVITNEEPISSVDFQLPLMSLPRLLFADLDHVPSPNRYLRPLASNISNWESKLKLDRCRINIGIACSGNVANKHDKFRSLGLSFFEPLSRLANLYLIQKDLRESDKDFLGRNPKINFLGDQITSFEDSASIVEHMDLIVTVCTSLAHLAGALGKRTAVLLTWNSDWRWFLNRQDSPWYSSVKLFRQTSPGDWESVIQDVISDLKRDTLAKSP